MAVGVFGLQVAYKLKRTELLSLDDTHGWFGGGRTPASPATISTVDRVDFSNDTGTASIRSPLTVDKYLLAATGNSNYGWFGGGLSSAGAAITTVERINFSTDSSTASVRGPLSAARYTTATGNSNYGWFGGGVGAATLSTVDRIDFSNDSSTASVRGPLSLARFALSSTGNSNYGWFGGGFDPVFPGPVSRVDRIDFSNDSATASPRGPLSLARNSGSGSGATANLNFGWFGGGYNSTPAVVSTIDRIDFSNDLSIASVRGPLSLARGAISAAGNSNYGWFGGGRTPTSPFQYSTVDRVDFSNDSVATSIRGPLSALKRQVASTSGQAKSSSISLQKTGNFGWFGGGSTPNPGLPPINYSTVDRIDFSNDSLTASVRGPLSLARRTPTATGNSNYGWFGGGNITTPTFIVYSTVDRVDFSNDSSTASVRGPLSLARQGLVATGNSNYGWFGGGYFPGPGALASTVDRIDFSNDSIIASVRGLLRSARDSATGNSNYGWFGGGQVSAIPFSTVDRIDFSNDSVTSSARGPLSSARSNGLGATSGQAKGPAIKLQKAGNYGWFGGGSTPTVRSTVDRIDFSNDLSTASVRGSLSAARGRLAATGNSNYGWFGGGEPLFDTVDRINFSSDSVAASPRSPLSSARYGLAATGNSNYGWFGGGRTPAPTFTIVSTVDRINFSNDSVTASVRGPLSLARFGLSSTGNSNYGWFGSGIIPGPGAPVSTVDRIDFSNDSVAASPRGSLSSTRSNLAATANSNYGWFGGGYIAGSYVSTVDRINFSNDSVAASPRGLLSAARAYSGGATGNSNYGWFGGGFFPAALSTVDRINFSNDSSTASVRGPLSLARFNLAATSNTSIG